jgi:arylformamidase
MNQYLKEDMEMNEDQNIGSGWIDISYPLSDDMVHWPASPIYPHIEPVKHPSKGDRVTMTQLNITVHNGTHVDAPLHFIENGTTIDHMPLEVMMGEARIIEIQDKEAIKPDELSMHDIRAGERILFKTRNSSLYSLGSFVDDYVYITNKAAVYLRDKGVSVVGIDYLAVGSIRDMESLFEVHKTFLGSGVWIVEGLNLSDVKPGIYEMICLPIKLTGGDASPARAIVRPLRVQS